MNHCLEVGGLLEYKGSWKKTTLYRYVNCKTDCVAAVRNFDRYYPEEPKLSLRALFCISTISGFSGKISTLKMKEIAKSLCSLMVTNISNSSLLF